MAAVINRRMLSKQEEKEEVEVRREDQNRINRFSTLHRKQNALLEEQKIKQKEKDDLEEVSTELELADEDEKVSYRLGDSFVKLPLEKAQELLAQSVSTAEEEVNAIDDRIDKIKEEMEELKLALYGRFGRSINLEA